MSFYKIRSYSLGDLIIAAARLPDSNLESKSKQLALLFTVIFFIFYYVEYFLGGSEKCD